MSQYKLFAVSGGLPNSRKTEAPSLLSWVGSKQWLAPYLVPVLLPLLRTGAPYLEVFAGSLAIYIHLWRAGYRGAAYLSDVNTDLINLYRQVQHGHQGWLWGILQGWEREAAQGERAFFYRLREEFNERKGEQDEYAALFRAAAFVYLNRYGFNGLTRYNKKKNCTTPWGGERLWQNRLSEESLDEVRRALEQVTLSLSDFRVALHPSRIDPGAIIYADPPYDGTFKDYYSTGFGEQDHRDLRDCLTQAASLGTRVVLSYGDSPLIRELYKGWEIKEIPSRYAVGGESKQSTELLISNWRLPP